MNVVIESLAGSREKYTYDPAEKIFRLKKLLPVSLVFPFSFGFIPDTIAEDGDPLDAFVISEIKGFTGCYIDCRIIGCILLEQIKDGKKIRNDRFLAIPEASEQYSRIKTIRQLDDSTISLVEKFLLTYMDLEGKKPRLKGKISSKDAIKLINESKTANQFSTK